MIGGHLSVGGYLRWLVAAALGNTVGGVVIVALLNYGQVIGAVRGAGREGARAGTGLQALDEGMEP